jgi:nicotinamidase-related amidase
MSNSDTALIVIDVQDSFRHRPYFTETDLPAFMTKSQALIDGAKAQGMKIAQIFHVEDSGAFAEESGLVATMAPLAITPDAVFKKRRHSALVGSGLDVWLVSNGIRRLLITGIRTEQCCETTTRHASDLGYQVDFVSEATLSFPMIGADGVRWSASEIKARTELVLAGRFARIATVAEALAGPEKALAA